MYKIMRKEILAPGSCLMDVEAPVIARKRKPGQFVVLRMHEQGERIPLTIADSDPEKGTVLLVFQEVGKSTMEMATMEEGDAFLDVVGPLGNPTHIENFGTVVCIGGGLGTAPVYAIAKGMKEGGNTLISIIGARTKELLIFEEEMKAISDRLLVSTDDGSYGYHGFVTHVLQNLIDEGEKIDLVVGVGPVPMMRALCRVTEPHKLKTVVSLNPIMVDASGMCGACRVTVGGRTRFVCVDGPEFDGHEVDFDELVKRQRMYLEQEKVSRELFEEHQARCLSGGK